MNTFTDAQLIVSPRRGRRLLDRVGRPDSVSTRRRARAIDTLVENGFIVDEPRGGARRRSKSSSASVREDTDQLRVTVLTTLQCNFACDYCIQGDHGDYNKHAAKMSLETAARVAAVDRAAAGRRQAGRASR